MSDGSPPPRLILASTSPRRLALLRQAGIEPDAIMDPGIDETVVAGELPRLHALRLAGAKAAAVAARVADDSSGGGRPFGLAADTVVACGRRILPKASTRAEAERCLDLLSGRRHRVYTGVCVHAPDGRARSRLACTVVRFKRLSAEERADYLAAGEWHGKAGGYAIQGRAEAFVAGLNGTYSNVVGQPVHDTVNLLRGLGWRPPPPRR